jgi:hypothetical protein
MSLTGLRSSASIGRPLAALSISKWKTVKESDDLRGLILTNIVARRLSFVRRAGPFGLSLFDQVVPALAEVFFNFPHAE